MVIRDGGFRAIAFSGHCIAPDATTGVLAQIKKYPGLRQPLLEGRLGNRKNGSMNPARLCISAAYGGRGCRPTSRVVA